MGFLNDAIFHFRYDYHHNRKLFYLELIGTLFLLIPAFMLSVFDISLVIFYSALCIANILNLISGHMRKSGFLILINGTFFFIDLYGVLSRVL